MRLHSLEVSAFLAYGGTASVDFERLTESGFFLIHGETGAGKTTLLDAISFAIYGRLPGAREHVRTIRSDHADPATPTRVVLDASVGGTRLRITRSPRYERPKRRGDGTTVEAARVAVERHTGAGWEPWTTASDEAGSALKAWIGLEADQFFRLVLIPQGAFAAFLHASSKDRSRVLAELFRDDLVVYRRVQEWCRDQLASADVDRDAASLALAKERARIAQVLGLEADDDVLDVAMVDQRLAELDGACATACADRDVAAAVLATARTAHTVAEQQLRDSERWRQAQADVQRVQAQIAALRATHPVLHGVPDDDSDAQLDGLERAAAARLREAQVLADARAGVLEARAAVARARERSAAAAAQQAVLVARSETMEIEAQRLTAARDDGRTAAEERADVAQQRTLLDAHVVRAARRDAALRDHGAAQEALDAAEAAAAVAVEALAALRGAATASQASTLAALLVEGQPCPVCGALEHPHPHPAADAVDPALLRDAEQGVLDALAERERRAAAVSTVSMRLAELRADLAGHADDDEADLRAQRDALLAREDALRARSEAASAAAEALTALTDERGDLTSRQAQAEAERLAAVDELTAAQATLAARANAAGVGVDDDIPEVALAPLEQALADLRSKQLQLRALLDALRVATGALAALDVGGVDDLPDVGATKAALAEAEAAVTARETTVRSIAAMRDALEQRRAGFASAVEAQANAEAARARLAALADPVNGRGPGRTLLTDYYLAARLRQVLERANGRLLRMTDNRFTFVFDADARGSGYQSLEIAVHDAWSGSARPVSSLSGGETFTASLALALGLADIVEAEAGGRALDSLFIDEGFGTLSTEYLQRVMQDLERLRATGRLVGVISHVPEMRQRIPMQLQVTRGVNGSSVALVDAGDVG